MLTDNFDTAVVADSSTVLLQCCSINMHNIHCSCIITEQIIKLVINCV